MSARIADRAVVRRRIVFLYANAGDERDAVARAVTELQTEFEARGHEVATLEPVLKARSTRWKRAASDLIYLGQALSALLLDRRVATVVSVDSPPGIRSLATFSASIRKIRHVAWVMDIYSLQATAGLMSSFRRKVELRSLRDAPELITLGECMLALITRESERSRPSHVLPIWQDSDWLRAGPGAPATLGPVRLLYSGHAGTQHPLVPLVEAVCGLDEHSVSLRIVGSGAEVDRVREYLRVNPSSQVDLRPAASRDEALENLREADVHVASLAEAFTGTCVPSKAVAAMALGKPVLFLGSAEVQVARELLSAGAGVVAPSGDVGEIRLAIERMQDRERLHAMGRASLRQYERAHTLSGVADRWVSILNESR